MTRLAEPKEQILMLDKNYKNFLVDIKERLHKAQVRAALAVNADLVRFYWELGTDLVEKQKMHQWGDKFLIQLSRDMRAAFPGMQGLSVTNFKRMRLFVQAYPIGPQAVDQLPWGHIASLIHKVKEESVRAWYAQQTMQNGWSRSVLEMQIESGLYERQARDSSKVSNFQEQLPAKQSQLATEILKDPYNFDFLTIEGKAASH